MSGRAVEDVFQLAVPSGIYTPFPTGFPHQAAATQGPPLMLDGEKLLLTGHVLVLRLAEM